MDVFLDFFPPYFRGHVSATAPNVQVSEIEMHLPEEIFEGPDQVAAVPRAFFVISHCPIETVQQFAREYEKLHETNPGDENELV